MNITAFILAAGLGERLRPITEHIPKPLIPILGKPVLQSIFEKISSLPINNIGINLHHKRAVIGNWISQSEFNKNIEIFPEEPILGTGGALKNAEDFLKNSTFLVHNSDIISDIDLEKLIAFHLSSKNLATLAIHNYPEFNKLEIDERGFLRGIGMGHPHPNPPPSMGRETKESINSCGGEINTESPPSPSGGIIHENTPSPGGRGLGGGGAEIKRFVAFTGIAVYQPEFLKFLPKGVASIVDAWLRVMREGYKIGTLDVTGCYWSDIGTPASYAKAIIHEFKKTGETVYIHHSINWCKDIEFDGYVVIENEINPSESPPLTPLWKRGAGGDLNRGIGGFSGEKTSNQLVSLRNCLVLPGTKIGIKEQLDTPPSPPLAKGGMGGWSFENCILGPGFKIDLSESDLFNSTDGNTFLIGTGGSDRKYYRVKSGKHPVVLMQWPDGDLDFQRHIEYTRFFQKYSIPVPELFDIETDKRKAFFEDLGDLSLYIWLKCPRELEKIERAYRQIIDILILFHARVTEHVSECPLLQDRIFDYAYLRWETNYFIERFVEGIRNILIKNPEELNNEFHRLALKVDSFHKTVIHRDFQSQNIMVTRGGIPRLLDYQGARIGPPAYDVVSILWDPYYHLEDNVRERLLNYYIGKMSDSDNHRKDPGTNPPIPPLVKGGKGGFFNKMEFKETLLPCRLQRHMQAIGAYGFLSAVKGKKYFLKYVPEGLRLLKEAVTLVKDEYPVLYNLVMSIP